VTTVGVLAINRMARTESITDTFVPARAEQWARRTAYWLLTTVGAAGLVGTTWFWLGDGGISSVNNLGSAVTTAGRLTGLYGAYLMLVQVLMMARLPFLQWAIPFERLTVLHRVNGKIVLYLILAHVVLILVGYSLLDRISVLTESWTVISTYRGMIAATVGIILLVVVAVTSFVIVRRRMRYELWFLVHLMAYAAVITTWFHEIPTGNDFVTNVKAAAFWTGIYVATLQLVIIFRFVVPAVRTLWHGLRVAEVVRESDTVTSIRVTGRSLNWLNARAGQFFQWRFLDRHRWFESHPFSLSAEPDGRSFRLTVKASGDFTTHLHTLKPGTFVAAEGPFGGFIASSQRRAKVALIAAGIGITPIRALLAEMKGDITLLYRAMSQDDLVLRRELEELATSHPFSRHYIVGDHRSPENQHLMGADHIRSLVPDIRERDVYLCGPPVMVEGVKQTLHSMGIPRRRIHVEQFAL
jgi:predicted ferric reductase